MKHIILLILFFIPLLGCEDTKKTLSKPEAVTRTSEKKAEPIITEKVISEKKIYPKITQENVINFFTEYGVANPEKNVRISTYLGDIGIVLFEDTPLHRANFIYLVKQGYFNDTFFHRVVPNFIIQAGSSDSKSTSEKRVVIGSNYRLPYEKGSGKNHRYGTVSGAKEYRKNPDNMTAPFEFFIFLGPIKSTTHLNGKYTIFGKVTKGMNVVKKLANLPADDGDWPLNNVYIKAEILD